jgi:endonuclease/exonuclease/phosphatase family metal-dependent hydrolase
VPPTVQRSIERGRFGVPLALCAIVLVMIALAMSSGCRNSRGMEGMNRLAREHHLARLAADQSAEAEPAAALMLRSTAAGALSPAPIDVLTFNMQHRDRPRELAVIASRLRDDLPRLPDFILCQEVVFGRGGKEDNTAAELANELGFHSRGTKRSSDREGIAIISRYPFEHYEFLNLQAQTSPLLLGFRRLSVMAEFQVPAVGRVRVVNVHFTNWSFEHHVRAGQLAETLQWIATREADVHADFTFVGGDFNIKPKYREKKLLHDLDVTGGIEYLDFNSDAPTRGGAGSPSKRVDYVFVSAPHAPLQFERETRLWLSGLTDRRGNRFWPSDHVPVLHEYTAHAGPAIVRGERPAHEQLVGAAAGSGAETDPR